MVIANPMNTFVLVVYIMKQSHKTDLKKKLLQVTKWYGCGLNTERQASGSMTPAFCLRAQAFLRQEWGGIFKFYYLRRGEGAKLHYLGQWFVGTLKTLRGWT